MGKLQIAVTLPKRILLQGWANDENSVNINGEYTYTINFDISIIQGGPSAFYNGYKHNTLNSFIYFAGAWQFLTNADPNQWDNPSTSPNVLPLTGWIQNNAQGPAGIITILENISGKNNKISIKKQNLTSLKVGGGRTVNNPSSVYVFKGGSINTLADIFNPINFQVNDTIFITSLELFLNDDYDFLFQVDDHGAGKYWRNEQTNMNNYVIPVNYIIYFNTSNNNNIQVSNGAIIQKYNSGKISLFFDTLPLNTQSIRLNLGYELDGCGNDFVLTQNGVWSQSQNGCDYFVRWDNKNGTLPYRWRLFYTSDGRTDRASHPTAGPDSLPKKGWSNGMTISII
jgi:hypothetical protein